MAYYVDFMSFGDTAYRVEIGDTGGTPLPLTGGPEPFVTQEDDGGDLFTPVRLQTGTIRVIDDGSLMADIIPENNTTTKVILKRKSSNTTVWEGFLCAAGYSQPWDGNLNMIELPVQSVLSSLYDSTIDDSFSGQLISFGDIINAGLESIGYYLHSYSSSDDCGGAWASEKIPASVFFSHETVKNQGTTTTAYFGKSYGEIIEDICKLFGLMCRDTGTGLFFSTYDKPTGFAVGIITSVFTFKGIDNSQGFIQGGREAVVRLDIPDTPQRITFPKVDETSDAPLEKTVNGDQTVYVQVHPNRTNLIETYTYLEYNTYNLAGTSDYSTMLSKSLINGYSANPYYRGSETPLITGAFPVRWAIRRSPEDIIYLEDGLYIQTQYYKGSGSPTRNLCYSLRSGQEFRMPKGCLNITFELFSFVFNSNDGTISFTDSANPITTEIDVAVRVGTKYWNVSSKDWVETGDELSNRFTIRFDNEIIRSNKTSDMLVEKNSGYFIPVENIVGDVELYILNVTYTNNEGDTLHPRASYAKIIRNIVVEYLPIYYLTVSNRDENTYRRTIMLYGFRDTKEIHLAIGTMNNNIPSDIFIKSDETTYTEALLYGSSYERPEMRLVNRMVTYYGKARQTLRAKVGTGLGLFDTLYSHGGRVFVGIDAQHNWRDDTQEVEFIEVRTE
jgi:hypothetical protein